MEVGSTPMKLSILVVLITFCAGTNAVFAQQRASTLYYQCMRVDNSGGYGFGLSYVQGDTANLEQFANRKLGVRISNVMVVRSKFVKTVAIDSEFNIGNSKSFALEPESKIVVIMRLARTKNKEELSPFNYISPDGIITYVKTVSSSKDRIVDLRLLKSSREQ